MRATETLAIERKVKEPAAGDSTEARRQKARRHYAVAVEAAAGA